MKQLHEYATPETDAAYDHTWPEKMAATSLSLEQRLAACWDGLYLIINDSVSHGDAKHIAAETLDLTAPK
jgi:hypothetical protein